MRRDPVPAYYRIYQTLRERIAAGTYRVGTRLPTDNDIMVEFGVSRHTARSAVEELVASQLVRRFAGRGTFVLEGDPVKADWSARDLEDLKILDPEARFVLHALEYIEPSVSPRAAAVLQVPSDRKVLRISWARVRPSGPIAFCAAHVSQDLAERLPPDFADRLESGRTIPLIEKYCDVQAFRVQQVSSAITADAEMAAHLQVEPGAPLLLLQRTYFDVGGNAIYYSDLYVRSDRYLHRIELFRHRQRVERHRFASSDQNADR